ncbi:MAG: prepilin-type N-terminal cleavage/methylation domain-containing protein, partial [Proteobacteria bacterium]|nr:prepilin-type N-terminal cleavage/methylation domain-containing protein [Pseudomonadota bacterium]
MDRTQLKRRQQGFTLVELMVAMAVGLILMAALYQFFIAQQRQYGRQDDVLRLQQNARVAQDLVIKTVQQAGGFAPTTGTSISMRGLPILAASDRYLALQFDDPYRPADQGVVTADEVVIFAVSKPSGAATQYADDGDGSAQVNVDAYFDQDGDGTVENGELYGLRIPLVLTGPPYTFYRALPDPVNPATAAPRMEAITSDVEDLVFRYFDQNGDPIVTAAPPYVLTQAQRGRIRTVEMTLTLRARNADAEFTETFTPTANTVGSYNAAGNAQATPAAVTDGFRRRTFTT